MTKSMWLYMFATLFFSAAGWMAVAPWLGAAILGGGFLIAAILVYLGGN